MENLVVMLVFGLGMGILGGAIGHLVFGKDGKKEHKCIRHKELSGENAISRFLHFLRFFARFLMKSG